ncbi:MipA/OmpV family protein [Paraneptunicella aestuarii]|uniref:MipA/OmpV family protein n=1 Tax=Paraneptunicella aestuarii TaxID=2831148 RepID=UPI001E2B57D2|nr:MipA/OmpV family protein [Paraneptunicella aestuarii]UAA38416.1 MipA/OmpV family protein [Paraneptunicella aestuarii]
MTRINKLATCLLLLISLALSITANANATESETTNAPVNEEDFHWEVDVGLLLKHSQTLIDGLKYESSDADLDLWLSGGAYYKNFFIESTPRMGRPITIGYTLKRTKDIQFNLITGTWFGPIREDQQKDTHILDGIKNRNPSLEAGIEMSYRFDEVNLNIRMLHDILSEHNGSLLSVNVSKAFYTKTMMILPTIGLSYLSENAVDYYYGIDEDEATPTRPVYQPSGTWVASLHLYLERPLSETWSVISTAGYFTVGDSLSNSPIVQHDYGYNISVGVLRVF